MIFASENCELVISDFNISELHEVVARRIPERMTDVDVLLAELSYEFVVAPISPEKLINDPSGFVEYVFKTGEVIYKAA